MSCSACHAQVPGSLKTVASQSRSRTKKLFWSVGRRNESEGQEDRIISIPFSGWDRLITGLINRPNMNPHRDSIKRSKQILAGSAWNDVSISISATARVNHNKIATVYVRRLGLQWTRGWVLICIYKLNALDATRLKVHGPSPNLGDHQKYVDGAS